MGILTQLEDEIYDVNEKLDRFVTRVTTLRAFIKMEIEHNETYLNMLERNNYADD